MSLEMSTQTSRPGLPGGLPAAADPVTHPCSRAPLCFQMRTLTYTLLLAAALFAPAVLPAQDTVQWLDSYEAALEEAKRTGKPIFLEFRCSP